MNREIEITSAQNPKLKKAVRLHESRGRRQQGRIILFGSAEISRAEQSRVEIEELYVCPELVKDEQAAARLRPKERILLNKELFQKLAFGQRIDGLVAVSNRPESSYSSLKLESASLVVVLEAIEKPGNIGAVFRSAAAAGVDAIVLADPVSDVFHPNAIRSSLGAVFTIPSCRIDSARCVDRLNDDGFQVVVTRVDAADTYTEMNLQKRTAIVLGNEANGVSDVWIGEKVRPVTIPMLPGVDSLNIAMTATLMVFEARRQRSTG